GNLRKATLVLTDASAASLYDSGLSKADSRDDDRTRWPKQDELLLDGFLYGRISSEGKIDVTKRLDWVRLQPRTPFRQQPYLQLAKVLRESGDSDGALRVLEQMEARRRSSE